MRSTTDQQRRDQRAAEQVEAAITRMEQRVQEMTRELRMTDLVRRAAERAYRRARRARRYLFLPRHPRTQQRFLRMMVYLALATEPALRYTATKVARFYSRNYAYEWLNNPVAQPARQTGRDAIMRSGESAFGEAPLAGALAYVMFHHDELHIEHLSNYSEIYIKAGLLDRSGFFHDRGERMRARLGLPTYLEKPSLATPAPEPRRDKAEGEPQS
jgi:hypothetical protein